MPRPSGDDASSEPSALGGRTADHVPLPATPESVRSTQVSPDLGGMATGRWDSRSPSQVIPKEACADGLSVLGDKDIEVRRRRLCGCCCPQHPHNLRRRTSISLSWGTKI